MTSQAYVPYNGTAGWSGTETSKDRALYNLRSGKEYTDQQMALMLLKHNPSGLTWKEFAHRAELHHGSASGVLSVLHKSGAILRTTRKRDRCKVYMSIEYADKVTAEVYNKKEKPCPHCGLDTTV